MIIEPLFGIYTHSVNTSSNFLWNTKTFPDNGMNSIYQMRLHSCETFVSAAIAIV